MYYILNVISDTPISHKEGAIDMRRSKKEKWSVLGSSSSSAWWITLHFKSLSTVFLVLRNQSEGYFDLYIHNKNTRLHPVMRITLFQCYGIEIELAQTQTLKHRWIPKNTQINSRSHKASNTLTRISHLLFIIMLFSLQQSHRYARQSHRSP